MEMPGAVVSPVSEEVTISAEKGIAGSDAFQSRKIRDGLVLTIAKPADNAPLRASFDLEAAPFQFGFTYAGRNRCVYSSGKLRNQVHEMQAGSNGIFHLPETKGCIERPGENPAWVMGLIASPDFLRTYFYDGMEQLPWPLRQNLEGKKTGPLSWFGPDHPEKHRLLGEILAGPHTGGVGRLFLESRVLELLALQVSDYIFAENRSRNLPKPLGASDVERIHHAREILLRDLENPPSLQQLGMAVGMNEKKLKMGFRQVYGSTVFGCFREYRMQKAYEILEQGELNVTEAALAVGYQSLSHFSQSFRNRFGILPKTFLTKKQSGGGTFCKKSVNR